MATTGRALRILLLHEGSELRGEVHFTHQVSQEGAAVADSQLEGDVKAANLSLWTGRERGNL